MSWNGYPIYVCSSVLKRLRERKKNSTERPSISEEKEIPRFWFRVQYIGPIGEEIAKRCISKLHKYCKKNIKVVLLFDVKKVAFFCSNKDPVLKNLQSHAIYQFECPGCKASYVRKTDRCFELRLNEHSDFRTSAVGPGGCTWNDFYTSCLSPFSLRKGSNITVNLGPRISKKGFFF